MSSTDAAVDEQAHAWHRDVAAHAHGVRAQDERRSTFDLRAPFDSSFPRLLSRDIRLLVDALCAHDEGNGAGQKTLRQAALSVRP